MSWNFIGATLNLTHLAGMQRTYRVRFEQDGGEAVDMTNCTFKGAVTDTDGNETAVVCWGVAGEPWELGMQFPAMDAGSYRLEVWLTDDVGGESVRLFSGSLLVLGTSVAAPSRTYTGYKTLTVAVPETEGERLQAQFLASSAAEFSAVQAQREADRSKGEADRAQELTSGVQNSIDELNRLIEQTDELFQAAEGAAESIQQAVSYSVSISANETWVIGGIDTGKPSRGRDGFSPYIALGGNWWTFSDEAREYVDTGVAARGTDGHSPFMDQDGFWWVHNDTSGEYEQTSVCGRGQDGEDGMDADSVVRHVVNSYAEIPQSGETCNGHHYYYIDADSGESDAGTAYMWAETVTGQYGWVSLGMTWDIATESRIGGMRLGTNATVTEGAPVGLNSANQATVPIATYNNYGVVLVGSQANVSNGVPYRVSTGLAITEEDGAQRQRLANNLLTEGAVQHRLGKNWSWSSTLQPEEYYLGLMTTASFSQSRADGLSLNAASTTVLGGVYKATGSDDTRAAAVPNVAQVRDIVSSMAYGQGDVYTQAQTQAYVAQQIAANSEVYYTKADVDAMLAAQAATINAAWEGAVASVRSDMTAAIAAAKTELQSWVQAQGYVDNSALSGYMKTSSTVKEVQVLTEAEHEALDNPNATTLYISGGEA